MALLASLEVEYVALDGKGIELEGNREEVNRSGSDSDSGG